MKQVQLKEVSIRCGNFENFTVPIKEELLPWQKLGRLETASGYGMRLTTPYKVWFKNRWRRVYCAQFSNIGTTYIGQLKDNLKVDL